MYLREHLIEDSKVNQMNKELDKKCKCDKNLIVCGSPSSGFYTQCDCGCIGYFDDNEGRKLYYQ